MMKARSGVLLAAALVLAACGQESEQGSEQESGQQATLPTSESDVATGAEPVPEVEVSEALSSADGPGAGDCAPDEGLSYVCGLQNAEDLLALGDSGLLLASGMSDAEVSGHLYLIDPADGSVQELIFDGDFQSELDAESFPNCPGVMNLNNFSIHGLSLQQSEPGLFQLYSTGHGAREAIEIFELRLDGQDAALTWRGCVVLPANAFANSVAILEDGGFVATKMMDTREGFAPIAAGEVSGLLYEWHPGGEVEELPGTELSGPNGIVISDDQRYLYVTAMGTREVLRFDREADAMNAERVAVDIVPDNIRWAGANQLVTAGGNVSADCEGLDCQEGWSVVLIDAEAMTAEPLVSFGPEAALQGASTALIHDGEIWVGSFSGDRVARIPLPEQAP